MRIMKFNEEGEEGEDGDIKAFGDEEGGDDFGGAPQDEETKLESFNSFIKRRK